jgi:4-hydroxymandelate oxidase
MLLTAGGIASAALMPLNAATQGTSQSSQPIDPVNVTDFEPLARASISAMAWEYISGGAGDEISLLMNRESFQRIRLIPRALVDVSHLDTKVQLFGRTLDHPIILAPTAYHRLVHAEGELETARGAGSARAIMVVSTLATTSIEEIAKVATQPLWFQLYVQPDRGFTQDLVQRAQAAGCQALVVTVDTPVAGFRYREMRTRFALPPGMDRPHLKGLKGISTSHLPGPESIYSAMLDPTLTWKDIEQLLSFARVPVLLKGILHPDDAARAAQMGCAGIIVSNHGGRNLDTVPATIEVLPGVVAKVAGRIPVLVDGGIRRGTDVLKALALGARAVLIGRPYLYGLGAAGAGGVAKVVDLLRRELEVAMALTGSTSAGHLDSSVIYK